MATILIIFGSIFAGILLRLATTLLYKDDDDNGNRNDNSYTDSSYLDECC